MPINKTILHEGTDVNLDPRVVNRFQGKQREPFINHTWSGLSASNKLAYLKKCLELVEPLMVKKKLLQYITLPLVRLKVKRYGISATFYDLLSRCERGLVLFPPEPLQVYIDDILSCPPATSASDYTISYCLRTRYSKTQEYNTLEPWRSNQAGWYEQLVDLCLDDVKDTKRIQDIIDSVLVKSSENMKDGEGNVLELDLSYPSEVHVARGQSGDVIIPQEVTYINFQAFSNCRFTSFKIAPDSKLKKICSSAFVNTEGLVNISLPPGCEEIGDTAFRESTIQILNATKCQTLRIGDQAFQDSNLSIITFNKNCNLTLGEKCFEGCEFNLLQLPQGIQEVPNLGAAHIKKLIIPGSVTRMNENVLQNVDEVWFAGDVPTSSGGTYKCSPQTRLYIPQQYVRGKRKTFPKGNISTY